MTMTSPDLDEASDDLLAAEPAVLTEIRIGYARVSTGGQKLERQIDALTRAGCRRIFAEKRSGKNTERPELAAALEFMRPGDTLVVPSLDRLSRSLQELITSVGELRRREVGFTSLHESLDTTTRVAGSCSTSSPRSPSSSANSSLPAPTKGSLPPERAAASAAGPRW